MPKSRFYRDPVHGQIRYDATAEKFVNTPPDEALGWLLSHLTDCSEVQRLRHIRQNGLTNLVFHGAEHSRFSHSMGVAYLAREMYDRIVRNTGVPSAPDERLATCAAALLHDVGHGPFSHTLEEILREADIQFDHEHMTLRLIEDPASEIHQVLIKVDNQFPQFISLYIDKARRAKGGDHWRYKIISSQLDADRLDYLLRDARHAGLYGPSFDLPRILDMLGHLDNVRIAVDRRAITAVEAYLVTLDHMYRSVYYHHTVRAASALLSSTLRRAFHLVRDGAGNVFPTIGGKKHPLEVLFREGEKISIGEYMRLGEFHVWTLIEEWRMHTDKILADLSNRLTRRFLFKTFELKDLQFRKIEQHKKRAEQLAIDTIGLDQETVKYYVVVDEAERTSYKRYDWRGEGSDESIWMFGGLQKACPIEEEPGISIVPALKHTKYFDRLLFPEEIRDAFLRSEE